MIKNYFKIAWRNLMKYKLISSINLFGLTVGLTSCLLIAIYILNELSYDKHHEKGDRTYRVTRTFKNTEGVVSLNLCTISPPFGYYFPTDFPEIEKMTRLLEIGISTIKYQDKLINENRLFFADENLFDVFSIGISKGNPKTALADPFSVMLTEEVAKKYFGDEDPINKMIRIDNQFNYKVTGVYKAFPTNSHIHPSVLVSFATLKDTAVFGEERLRRSWGNNSFLTYLVLPKNYDPQRMLAQFPAFIDRRMAGEEYKGSQPSKLTSLGLQKITDIHLRSHTDSESEPNGNITQVYIFAIIAFLILLIACFNYMNLSTARAALRAKEIGIRKVAGASKKEIIAQFLSESIIITLIASILATGLCWLSLPLLSQLSGQMLSSTALLNRSILIPLLFTPFVVGTISGLYPAIFMSSFQPVQTIKGLFKVDGGGISFRKILVVSQFSVSIILIIATIVVFQQLSFVQKKSLGYDKNHIAVVPFTNAITDKYEAFRNELMANTNFKNATRSSRIPTGRLLDASDAYIVRGDSMQPTKTDIKVVVVDYDFIPTYEMAMAAGRNFSRDYSTDTSSYVLNETATTVLGWKTPADAIGKDFRYGNRRGYIVGVVKDSHFESMHQTIQPMVLEMLPPIQGNYNNISIKLSGNNTAASLAHLETTWRKFLPEIPYQYSFLDENFDALYKSELRQGNIFTIFACIAIFIASLGLFGLSAFAITQRVKEIGVRKVLGANVGNIVTLLSKDFLKLVLIAAMIAFPIAWFVMHNWLKDFAYRINIQWWVFIVAGVIALLIALLTVSFQAIKAAAANPVKSLRTE
jgi:putative ABC transport system permease protein